ncbi:MAG: beta-ketoacyl-[acyl-carrier-protein] synthase family protein, partial [Thermoanaerobaculia bacterium]|nr:beta-ketoacyl-[acyl-carrier-protein] synthase family protein [Thermoanaerobaculia bacterium]
HASRRIVVTGVGSVSPYGWGVEPFWKGLCSGHSGLGALELLGEAGFPGRIAGEVPEASAELAASFSGWSRLSRTDRFALAASSEAIREAALPTQELRAASVFFSSSTGGMLETEEFYCRRAGRLPGRPGLHQLRSQLLSAPAEVVARTFGTTSEVQTVSSACASGALAVGMAWDSIRRGDCDVALAGGADALCRTTYGGFDSLESISDGRTRPFCRERNGLSLGEGAATLVLETYDRALERGVEPLVEVLGYAATADAHHMTAPHPEGDGAVRALEQALAEADVSPIDISFVCAHGTGTDHNDRAESAALRRVFGVALDRLPVTATKATVGHLLGSAGAIEAVATVLMLRHAQVHPTPIDGTPDPELGIDLVAGECRPLESGAIGVSLNLAFGGSNAALVLARASGSRPSYCQPS